MPTPNIVEIIWHDLGDYFGCYGRSEIDSPNLDLLAAEGALFEEMYVLTPHVRITGVKTIEELYGHERSEEELYDLREDPDETINLACLEECRDVKENLKGKLFSFLDQTGDPLLAGDIEPGKDLGRRYEWKRTEEGRLTLGIYVE